MRAPHHARAGLPAAADPGLAPQGSGLPALKQERLNAPAILLLHKVAAYATSKLAEAGIHVQAAPMYYSAARQAEQVKEIVILRVLLKACSSSARKSGQNLCSLYPCITLPCSRLRI